MHGTDEERFLREAIALAQTSARTGGGPFGAVVVRAGRIVARGSNRVVLDGDPTAHAEVLALRQAARELGSHVLAGCTLYASCEPCPMCFGAALWARVERVVFAGSRADAAAAGFDDARLYEALASPPERRRPPFVQALREEGLAPFEEWARYADRVPY